jgi:hypothetical protein
MDKSLTTIVTCYFEITSKHTINKYTQWMDNMLSNIETPMVIYCDLKSKEKITRFRNKYLNNTVIHTTDFDQFYTKKWETQFNQHWNIDPEKDIHNPKLYMIWAEKSNFLKITAEENPFNSQYFMWCDIGCFRNRYGLKDIPLDKIRNWPNPKKVSLIPRDKICLTQTGTFPILCCKLMENGLTEKEFTNVPASIGGTMFIGSKEAVNEWHCKYYQTLQKFVDNNRFIGKDQNIMANIYIAYPDLVAKFDPNYGDPWFYFHWLFI